MSAARRRSSSCAECCVAVSGSVSLEMMYRRTPAVIVYRMRRFDLKDGEDD